MRRRPQPPLSFYDHHRQRYADKVPIPDAGEFLIGAYNGDGTVGPDGEFRVALVDMTHGHRWGLYPRLKAFGDGIGALRRAIDAGLLAALERGPVETRDEFAHRLLRLGFVDLSDRPLPAKVADERRRVSAERP